jgi:prepilin-type N-terminal cleavage/methylation domain-containing protein
VSTPAGRSRAADGLTLIELVIALAIFSLAVAAIFGIVGVASRSSLMTQQFLDLQHNARSSIERINEEVRWGGAPAPGIGGFIEAGPTAVAVTIPQDPEYPACDRPCRPYPKADPGRAYAVRFAFDPKTQTIRRQTDATGHFDERGWVPGGWEPRNGLVLADHVSAVRFEYFDENGVPTDSPRAATRLSMRIEVRQGRHSRFLVSDVFLRQR